MNVGSDADREQQPAGRLLRGCGVRLLGLTVDAVPSQQAD